MEPCESKYPFVPNVSHDLLETGEYQEGCRAWPAGNPWRLGCQKTSNYWLTKTHVA
jgi:hypothetical protein